MARKPVDTAIVVSVGPLYDDTDFKTLETGISYNESGMSVDLFKESVAGVTQLDLTLTSGGNNDWTHKGNGIYEIEITAAQNDTLGELWVVGVCDGVLPFESPHYEVKPGNAFDSLEAGTDKLKVHADEITNGLITADALAADCITEAKIADNAFSAEHFAASAILKLWNQVTSALTTAGTIGKLLVDMLDAAVSTRGTSDFDHTSDGVDLNADQSGATIGEVTALGATAEAEVLAAISAAIEAYRLHELMYTALGSQPAAGSLFADLTEDDGGTQRLNANALEEAPVGIDQSMLLETTVSSVTDQTHFVLAAGPDHDISNWNQTIVFFDGSENDSPSVRVATNWVASTKAVTIDSAPDFTVVATDAVKVFCTALGATAPTAAQVADAVFDEARADHDNAGSMGEAINNANAEARNKITVDRDTGDIKVYKDDGETVRFTRQITEIDNDTQGIVPQ